MKRDVQATVHINYDVLGLAEKEFEALVSDAERYRALCRTITVFTPPSGSRGRCHYEIIGDPQQRPPFGMKPEMDEMCDALLVWQGMMDSPAEAKEVWDRIVMEVPQLAERVGCVSLPHSAEDLLSTIDGDGK